MKFSVLLSVYKNENPKFLDSALYSIFDQTKIPNEVVLVEDGKLTDELYDVIKKYKTRYSKILKTVSFKNNRGLGLALRDGLLHCSNEIVFRMDTDDISVKSRFEKQLKIFKNYDVDVVGSNIKEFDNNMFECVGYRVVPKDDVDIKKIAKRRNPLNHVTIGYKKSKVLAAGNYEKMDYFEDYYLWIKMMKKNCKFYNIQDDLVLVRGGSNMINRRGGIKYIKSIINFEKSILKIKFINRIDYIKNIFIRIIVSITPNKLRTILYKKILRKNKYNKKEVLL